MNKPGSRGLKPKQLLIPMELYYRILQRCSEEHDTNESRVILRLMEKGLSIPCEPVEPPSDAFPMLYVEDDGDRDQPEIVRLRKIFPNNELEVQTQLKEIEEGLRQAGETEENIRLILYGTGNDE